MNANRIYRDAVHKLEGNEITLGEFNEMVKPLEDVEPVIHGHWILDKYDNACCSNCHREYSGKESYYKVSFCAYCGAKMDERDEVIENEVL